MADHKHMQNPLVQRTSFLSMCSDRNIWIDDDEMTYFENKHLLKPTRIDGNLFYSTYYIEWVDYLVECFRFILRPSKKHTFLLTLKGQSYESSFNMSELPEKLKNRDDFFGDYIDIKSLRKRYREFCRKIKFIETVDEIYYPYARYGAGVIEVRSVGVHASSIQLRQAKIDFNLDTIFTEQKVSIEDVGEWYSEYANKASYVLGGANSEWLQLWKEISWDKKQKVSGRNRLGIDYLQWALMLRRLIEEYTNKEVYDVDEMHSIGSRDIFKIPTDSKVLRSISLRGFRNEVLADDSRDYYHERFQRLQWLSNSFGINYQPRVTVYVEGMTEEKVLPKVFEHMYGVTPSSMGIEFIRFDGVDKLRSTSNELKEIKKVIGEISVALNSPLIEEKDYKRWHTAINKFDKIDIAVTSLKDLVSYNLEKWQTIPFFLSDNEGNIKEFIDSGKPINYKNTDYNVPADWKYLWGANNKNVPLVGNNFEMANFTDDEIAIVLSNYLGKSVSSIEVATTRLEGSGIKKIIGNQKHNKADIAKSLFENLYASMEVEVDKKDRPVFDVLMRISGLAVNNNQPYDLKNQRMNEDIITLGLQ